MHEVCRKDCEDIKNQCIFNCNQDVMCTSQCNRDEIICKSGNLGKFCFSEYLILDCPCDVNCPNGCEYCENSICDKSVLILNTGSWDSVPMVVDFKGNVDDDLDFKIENMSRGTWACSVTLNGDFLVFGNTDLVTQIIESLKCT